MKKSASRSGWPVAIAARVVAQVVASRTAAVAVLFAAIFAAGLAAVVTSSVACAPWQPRVGPEVPRILDKPDDSDVAALIPVGLETVIDIDMGLLRRSAWTAPLLEPVRTDPARRNKVVALGFDDIEDVDRIVYAVTAAGAAAPTLVIGQGRLEPARLTEAFHNRWPEARAEAHRGVSIWVSGENAHALLTGRTFVSGPPDVVRKVIDCSVRAAPAVGDDGELGPVRRALALGPSGVPRPSAVLVTTRVTPTLRARAESAWPLPRELRVIGLDLEVGETLDVDAVGVLDDATAARLLARRIAGLTSDRVVRLGARAAGLGALVDAVRVSVEGARTRATATVAAEHRSELTTSLRRFSQQLSR